MTQVRLADGSDSQRWDDYVRRHTTASPYHLSAWGSAIESAYGHRRIDLIAETQGRVSGVLPATEIIQPFRKGSYFSLPFCDVGGCISDSQEINDRLTQALIDLAKENGRSSVEIRERHQETAPIEPGFDGKVSMLLDLPESSDELFGSFKAKLRSQVRKAEKNGLTFRTGRGTEDIDLFYRVMARNMRDLGSPVHSRSWFDCIRKRYGEDMVIGLVHKGDVPVGAGILVFAEHIAAIPWASTIAEYNRLAPNMLLYWNLLKFATDRGCRVFDFGRSSYGEGTYRFKKQWGAEPVPLSWTSYDSEGTVQENAAGGQRLRGVAESLWRLLPVRLTTVIGPSIRKFVSL